MLTLEYSCLAIVIEKSSGYLTDDLSLKIEQYNKIFTHLEVFCVTTIVEL